MAKSLVIPVFMAIGIFFIGVYLNSLRLGELGSFVVLGLGVLLCSVSFLWSYLSVSRSEVPYYCLISLFILSYGLLMFFAFRYDVFHGADFIGEYKIASITHSTGKWPLELLFQGALDRPGRYASSLSVTFLPAMLSQITGIEILTIFRYILPAMGGFLSILLYMVVNKIFENKKIAYLSGMFLAIQYSQIFQMSYLFKQQIGILFLLFSVYALLKFRPKSPIIFLVFLGTILSSYAISLILFIVLVCFISAPLLLKVLRKKEKTPLLIYPHPIHLLFYFGALASWYFFVANPIFYEVIGNVQNIIEVIINYGPPFIIKIVSGQFEWGTASSAGTTGAGTGVDLWYYLSLALLVIGVFFSIIKLANNRIRMGWIFASFFFTIMFIVNYWRNMISSLDVTRFYSISNIFFVSMIAVALFSIFSVKKYRWIRYLKIILFVFILISIPMNLNLLRYQETLHYQPQSAIPPENRWMYYDTSFSDLTFSRWIGANINYDDIIAVEFRGWLVCYLTNHMNLHYSSLPGFQYNDNLLIIPKYSLEHNFWISRVNGPHQVLLNASNNALPDYLHQYSITYNDGKMILLAKIN